MYANVYGDKDLSRRCGEAVISVGLKLHPYAVHISNDLKDSDGRSQRASIGPAQFNPQHFTSDPRKLEFERTPHLSDIRMRDKIISSLYKSCFRRVLST